MEPEVCELGAEALVALCHAGQRRLDALLADLARARRDPFVQEAGDVGTFRTLAGALGNAAPQPGRWWTKRTSACYRVTLTGLARMPGPRSTTLIRAKRETGRPQVDISFPEIEKFDRLPPARVAGVTAASQ